MSYASGEQNLEFEKVKFENDRLWQYFEYHAKQRIQTFRYFVLLSGVLITGALTMLAKFSENIAKIKVNASQDYYSDMYLVASLIISVMLLVFTITFWLLDKRNNTMIKKSRAEMITLEKSAGLEYKIFNIVHDYSEEESSIKFHHCFNAIFISFMLLGISISIFAVCKLWCT